MSKMTFDLEERQKQEELKEPYFNQIIKMLHDEFKPGFNYSDAVRVASELKDFLEKNHLMIIKRPIVDGHGG